MRNGETSTKFVDFTFLSHKLHSAAVDMTEVDLNWSWSNDSSKGWQPITTTKHTIYTILDMPEAPWSFERGLWEPVLSYACVWARGQKTKNDVATSITKIVNGGLNLKYDIARGASNYVIREYDEEYKPVDIFFDLTSFLRYLREGKLSNVVNCTDCATITSTFANAIGCNLSQKKVADIYLKQGFKCNKIISIGGHEWAVPFPNSPNVNSRGKFSYHEVCMLEPLGVNEKPAKIPRPEENIYHIYDACLKLDISKNPAESNPAKKIAYLPTNMIFSTYNDDTRYPIDFLADCKSYRERLATNSEDGAGSCVYSSVLNQNPENPPLENIMFTRKKVV